MCSSASRSIRTVALLMVPSLFGTTAFPQAVKFIRSAAADPRPPTFMSSVRASCTSDPGSLAAAPRTASEVSNDAGAPCDTPLVSVAPVHPCSLTKPEQMGCEVPKDLVPGELAAMGKPGQKILRARDKVLEILQTDNACSAWLRQKDPDPAATFRTLNFEVDRHGEVLVHVSKAANSELTFRDPYVARVGQDTGAFSTITLNASGAFFQFQAPSMEISQDGGISTTGRPRSVNIGPYYGDSLAAQTLALLHEFGHVIDLLPLDYGNQDGKSVQNTAEVLRNCRAEIDSKSRRGRLQAAR